MRKRKVNDSTELTKVRQNLKTWLKAFNSQDIKTLFSLYDPESIYANASAPLMCGIEQIRPWYKQAFTNTNGTLLHKEEAAFQEGNMAVLIGSYYFKPPHENKEHGPTGRVALIYRRNTDGNWLLLFDMDNTPPDIKPEDFL